jgi:hypothetical protein
MCLFNVKLSSASNIRINNETAYWRKQYSRILDLGTGWSGQLHAAAALPPRKRAPDTHWIVDWMGPRNGQEAVERRKILHLLGVELRFLGRPENTPSLYQLSYPGSPSLRYNPEEPKKNIRYNNRYPSPDSKRVPPNESQKLQKGRSSYPCNRPWRPTGFWNVEAPTFSLDNRLIDGGEVK